MLRAATAYDDLPGMTPVFHSCPMQPDSYTDRVTFHTATGDVVATDRTQSCGAGMTVHRDGHLVDPQLGRPQQTPLRARAGPLTRAGSG